LSVLALFALLCIRPAFAKFDPSFVWTTLETDHFIVLYHQGEEEAAQRAARIAEDVHSRLAPRIGWTPSERTRLILADATDDPNGYATPIPYNHIVIYLTAPSGGQGLGLASYDDWLRLVITHEYTHILQLDMVNNVPSALQYVFGRIYFPNLFQPMWLIEGLATYEETEQTSGGRGRSPGDRMVLRMAALEGRFPTLAQMAVFPDSWPAGQVPYLFGESFTRYIADTYGRQGLADISTAYSGRTVPYLVESTALHTIGRRYDELWYDWKAALLGRFRSEEAEVSARGLTASTALTHKGFVNTGPAFSPDGTRIAYALAQGDEYPGVYVMARDGSGGQKIAENVFPSGASGVTVAWGPGGDRLYYTTSEVVRNVSVYDEITMYDFTTGAAARLTEGLRARDPRISSDGRWMVFVMERLGKTRIALLNMERERKTPAHEADVVPVTDWSADQYETPAWSPDGTRIAVGVWRSGGYRDIRIIDRTEARFTSPRTGAGFSTSIGTTLRAGASSRSRTCWEAPSLRRSRLTAPCLPSRTTAAGDTTFTPCRSDRPSVCRRNPTAIPTQRCRTPNRRSRSGRRTPTARSRPSIPAGGCPRSARARQADR
jgi:hypothetical protein